MRARSEIGIAAGFGTIGTCEVPNKWSRGEERVGQSLHARMRDPERQMSPTVESE